MSVLKKLGILMVVLVALGVVGSMTIAAAEPVIGTVVSTELNVRSQPNTTSEILVTVSQGAKFVLVEKVGDWWKVNVGMDGYVSAQYISVNGQPPQAPQASQAPAQPEQAPAASTKGAEVVEYAKQFLGTPYVYGGSSPSGFDCSGFTQYVYKHFGVTINRVAADQAKNGVWVAKENLQPGDLVFFAKPGRAIHHVGIYVGNGNYIHSPQTGDVVKIAPMTRSDYYTARRIF